MADCKEANTKHDDFDKSYNHILKYTGLFGGIQGLTVLISVLRNKLVAILIGSAGMGLVDIYSRTIDLLANATNLGIPFSAVKRVSELYEKEDWDGLKGYIGVVRTWSLLTALLGMFACCLFSPLISYLTFKDFSFISVFCTLSPMVAMVAIGGGELAILKGVRRLKKIALITILGALATLLITIPIYLFLGAHGIVPVLVFCCFALTAIQVYHSTRIYPWCKKDFSFSFLKKGRSMVKLGISYILAGIAGSGAEMIIRTYMYNKGSLSDVGLYAAGFIVCVTYSRLIFVAMDADYYPRLSGVASDVGKMNKVVNQQMEVCMLLASPLLIFFMMTLPFMIPLLYRADFISVIPMALCASFYLYFKSLASPIAYLSLAKGDSFTYFIVEFFYDIIFVVLVIICYANWGLVGSGVALSLSNLFDLLLVSVVYSVKYKFRFSLHVLGKALLQIILIISAWLLAWYMQGWTKYMLGALLLAVSGGYSFYILNKETTLLSFIKNKLKRRKR